MKAMERWISAVACIFLAACAVITVNVYFPEKAAKEAYKSLDEMLLKGSEEKGAPKPTAPPLRTPAPEKKEDGKGLPHSSGFSWVATAYAAESEAETLAVELSSMPEVIKAYDEMKARLPRLNTLFDIGAVGLTNQGLVTVRDESKVTAQDKTMIAAENGSRKTVVTAMAKAILKLNNQKESKAALGQVIGKAAATFADTRREEAKPGWWVQLENGRWLQK